MIKAPISIYIYIYHEQGCRNGSTVILEHPRIFEDCAPQPQRGACSRASDLQG